MAASRVPACSGQRLHSGRCSLPNARLGAAQRSGQRLPRARTKSSTMLITPASGRAGNRLQSRLSCASARCSLFLGARGDTSLVDEYDANIAAWN